MNSRERVRAVLERRLPDVVPTDMWGCASRIHVELYKKLAEHFGLKDTARLIRPGTVTPYEDYALSDILGCDFRHINIGKPDYYTSHKDEHGYVIDEWGIGRDVSAEYPTVVYFPLAGKDELSDIDNFKWPVIKDEGRRRGLGDLAKDWYENTDKAITATAANSGMFLEMGQFLRGHEQFLMDMCLAPEYVEKLCHKLADLFIELNLYYLEPIAPYIEWVEFTSDLGTQNAPFISPSLFKQCFKEPTRRIFDAIKNKYPHLKIMQHSCGSIREFIPDFIDIGVDILNPIQPLAAHMHPGEIKKEYGDKLIFNGAIDIQEAMPGSIEDVRREVKLRIDQMGAGGGYIVSPNNHLQPDIPVENVIELYTLAKEYGRY